tara:strand:+ start:465 stop:839 length:375 start_codon:yes stop_codon:yes gene_type:complete
MADDRASMLSSPMLSEEKKAQGLKTVADNEIGFASLFDEAAHDELVASGKRRMSFKAMQAAIFIHLYQVRRQTTHFPPIWMTICILHYILTSARGIVDNIITQFNFHTGRANRAAAAQAHDDPP